MKSLLERFENSSMVEPYSSCWLWLRRITPFGYGQFKWRNPRKTMGAHRAAWLLYRGEIPKGMFVLHRCDTPACVNPDHLWLGTLRDNTQDAIKKGRFTHHLRKGDDWPRSRLTSKDVEDIRNSTESNKPLAARYGVHHSHICAIRKGRRWKHIMEGVNRALHG